MKRIILIGIMLFGITACAVVRDPVTNKTAYMGWGNVRYERTMPDGQKVCIDRQINTKEVLLELGGLMAAIGGALAVVVPLLL